VQDIDHRGSAFVRRVLAVDEDVPLVAWILEAFRCCPLLIATL
jgi:hypothetical protein